jgi:hypothetical protein
MGEYDELSDYAKMKRVLLYPDRQKAYDQNRKRSGTGLLRDYLDEGIRLVYEALEGAVDDLMQQGWVVLDTTNDTMEDTAARLHALVGTTP